MALFPVAIAFGVAPSGLLGTNESETWHKMMGRIAPPVITVNNRVLAALVNKSKIWPRDYPVDVVRDVLDFVARGEFTYPSLVNYIISTRRTATEPDENRMAGKGAEGCAIACIRRAKLERRIRWCPYSQQYVARPAWQYRPKHDRRGWRWPQS